MSVSVGGDCVSNCGNVSSSGIALPCAKGKPQFVEFGTHQLHLRQLFVSSVLALKSHVAPWYLKRKLFSLQYRTRSSPALSQKSWPRPQLNGVGDGIGLGVEWGKPNRGSSISTLTVQSQFIPLLTVHASVCLTQAPAETQSKARKSSAIKRTPTRGAGCGWADRQPRRPAST